ncbi:ABC transporter ATP-binding protein [Kitasatospora sp. NPDC096147]|uniref:ABC transporter ATP-binding protein n=1 Tax=Kitasatospora sp. NPDC096147 TaxID=3364093 RepID=UPI003813262B
MALPQGALGHRYQGEHPLRTLLFLIHPDRARAALAVLVFLAKHSPIWLLPLVTANVLDVVVDHRPLSELWWNTGLLLVILALNLPLHLLYVHWMHGTIRRMGTRLRSALCHRMQQLSIGFHARVTAGALQSKVIRDVENIENAAQQTADNGLAAFATLVGALAVIGWKAPAFLPVFLVLVPAAAYLVTRLRTRLHDQNESFRREVEQLAGRVGEMTTLIPVTRAHGLERTALRRMDRTLDRVLHAGLRLDLLNGRFGALSWILLNAIGVGCLAGAAVAAYQGWWGVTPGAVVMLSAYFSSLTGSVTSLLALAPQLGKGFASVRSVGELLQAPDLEENAGKAEVTAVRGRIDFQGVTLRHPGADRPAVEGLDLTVRAGETIALVGGSGAGKSTVLNLVIGFLRPTEGRILLDGTDMEGLDLRSYRRFLSVVPQEPVLFDGTIRENVAYGLRDVPEAVLDAALRDANAQEFVDRLAHGKDTLLGERGIRLSGGQKQRLAIARALVRDPRVLILDEATSALDPRSEALVQQAMAELVKGRTVFVVAHRLSTIRAADRIAVLEHGRLVELGSHAELIAGGGAYGALHEAAAS